MTMSCRTGAAVSRLPHPAPGGGDDGSRDVSILRARRRRGVGRRDGSAAAGIRGRRRNIGDIAGRIDSAGRRGCGFWRSNGCRSWQALIHHPWRMIFEFPVQTE